MLKLHYLSPQIKYSYCFVIIVGWKKITSLKWYRGTGKTIYYGDASWNGTEIIIYHGMTE